MPADHTDTRRILAVSYYYAPIENPGTRRVGSFVRYLPQYGYHPVVLTTSSYGTTADDDSALILRAPDLLDVARSLVRRVVRVRADSASGWQGPLVAPDSRISAVLEQVMIPDIQLGWLPGAVMRGRVLLRTGFFRAIFSSSPPVTAHLVGYALKRASGLPWVADFRDGWLFEPPNKVVLSSIIRQRIEGVLERAVAEGADRIVTVNDVLADDMRRRYPATAKKVVVISNGYDPAEYNFAPSTMSSVRFRVVHTGSLAYSRKRTLITGLLAALQRLRQQHAPVMERLDVRLIGKLSLAERAAIADAGLDESITIVGSVAHSDVLRIQSEAEVLLLVTAADDASVTTSKLFEYLASGRPILALTGRSAAGALIEELNAGEVVHPDDVDGICRALEGLYRRWLAGELHTRVDARVHRFDRRILTGELAKVFRELDPWSR
ncbi:MAG: glycosyltransferase [Chloroflexi bacterium]|nr:glycosyltransferase [Chloroflexota bacterium]